MSNYAVMPLHDYKNICNAIREKTTTEDNIKSGEISDKISDVYDAGKLTLLKDSKYMKGTKSGFTVTVNDCSPVEQELKITLSSTPGIENLLPTTYEQLGTEPNTTFDGLTISNSDDGWLHISGFSNGESYDMGCFVIFTRTDNGGTRDFYLEPNTEYFIGVMADTNDPAFDGKIEMFLVSEAEYQGSYPMVFDSNTSFTVSDRSILNVIGIRFKPNNYFDCRIRPYLSTTPLVAGPEKFDNVSVTITGTNTETKTVVANADGTVEGLNGSYPDFILSSDTDGVIIQCGYYKDVDKACEDSYEEGYEKGKSEGGDTETAYNNGFEDGKKSEYDMFWDNFQNYGNKTDYSRTFSSDSWNVESFKPKYDIVDTGGNMTFRNSQLAVDLVEYLNALGVKFIANITGNPTQMFMFSLFTRIGEISFNTSSQLAQTFASCPNLETIDKIVSYSNTTYANNTFGCPNLKNITFGGVINSNISFASCKLLTHDSLMSIINHLSTTTTTKTLTLHADSKALLSDAEKAIATQKGWTIA